MASTTIPILPAIIAVIGVFFSALISYLTSKRSFRNEITKLETAIIQNYSDKILEERNKRYPDIYYEISQMAKNIIASDLNVGRPVLDVSQMQEFILRLDELNSKHSVFFSSGTGSLSHKLRIFTYNLITSLKQCAEPVPTMEQKKELLKAIERFEVAMKKDLGVFVIEFQDPRNKLTEPTYAELKQRRLTTGTSSS